MKHIYLLSVLWFIIGCVFMALIIINQRGPTCPDNLPIRVYDLERKTLTCFPPPLLYGQGRKTDIGRKEIKKEI